MGPAAVPASLLFGKVGTPHLHFGFGLSEIIHQLSCLISQSRQSKQSWHVEQSLHATAPPHAPDDPDNRHTTHNGRLSRTIGHRAANNSPHRWGGGRIPHTPEQHRHLTRQRSLDVAGALPSVLSRLFNGGVRPRAAPSRSRRETSEPHAMRACAMAPLAPCLRQID